jgi:hypothetical protein
LGVTLEVGRRWVNGRWTTDIENEGSGGGGGSSPVQASEGTLVAAPGAGLVNVPVFVAMQFTAGGTIYTFADGTDKFYVVPSAAWLDWSSPPYAIFPLAEVLRFNSSGESNFSTAPAGGYNLAHDAQASPVADFEDTEIVLATSSAGIADGDGTLFVTVLYWTIPLA